MKFCTRHLRCITERSCPRRRPLWRTCGLFCLL